MRRLPHFDWITTYVTLTIYGTKLPSYRCRITIIKIGQSYDGLVIIMAILKLAVRRAWHVMCVRGVDLRDHAVFFLSQWSLQITRMACFEENLEARGNYHSNVIGYRPLPEREDRLLPFIFSTHCDLLADRNQYIHSTNFVWPWSV